MSAAPAPVSLAAPPKIVFTLGTALRWLGHDCPDRRCCEPIAAVPASVWFIRREPLLFFGFLSPMETLVLLDLAETGEPLARIIDAIIHEVDSCTRGDAIHIRRRHSGENRHDLIALAWRCDPPRTRFPHPRSTVDPTIEQGGQLTEDDIRDPAGAAVRAHIADGTG